MTGWLQHIGTGDKLHPVWTQSAGAHWYAFPGKINPVLVKTCEIEEAKVLGAKRLVIEGDPSMSTKRCPTCSGTGYLPLPPPIGYLVPVDDEKEVLEAFDEGVLYMDRYRIIAIETKGVTRKTSRLYITDWICEVGLGQGRLPERLPY